MRQGNSDGFPARFSLGKESLLLRGNELVLLSRDCHGAYSRCDTDQFLEGWVPTLMRGCKICLMSPVWFGCVHPPSGRRFNMRR